MTTYSRFCYKYFGSMLKPFKKYFLDIRADLKTAGLNFTLDEYLSTMFFTSLFTFLLEIVIMSFIFGLFFNPFISVSLATTLAFSLSGLIFFLFYSYPKTLSKKRAENIDKSLPFAASYLSAISAGNVPPSFLFSTLSNFEEFGEVTRSAKNITRNIRLFGMNFTEAVKREAQFTPSKDFRELLWGINTSIATGTDLGTFLREKTDLLMSDYRRKIRKYSQDLSMFIEVYLTLIITSSILFVVLTSIMAGTGFEVVSLQSFIVFIFLPIMSIAFIFLMKMRSPIK